MRRPVPLAIGLAAALLVPAMPASAAPAADTTPPQLRSIELAQSEVTVSGLQTVLVGVRVRLTDDTGVEAIADSIDNEYWPALSFTAQGAFVPLVRTEGTAQDGIWTGRIPVTSAWSGVIKPNRLQAYDTDMRNQLEVDPSTVVDTPSITVHSSHRPAISMSFSPEPATKGKPVTQHVRVTDSATGLGVPNAPLVLGYEIGCIEYSGGRITARTDSAGNYQRTVAANQTEYTHCVWVTGQEADPQPGILNPTVIASVKHAVRFQKFTVSAVPAKTAVPAGTNVDVNGVAAPVKPNKTLQLQRLSGGVWTKVSTGNVRTSGRYTIVATPPGQATYSYRVYAPGDESTVGATSGVFTIRGT